MADSAKASAMKMVITLKSGVQIKADVEDFTTGRSPVFGELRDLKWTTAEQAEVRIGWLDIGEVAAVHGEFSYGSHDDAQVTDGDLPGEEE